MAEKALVLFSGGVDSTTCLGLAVNKYGKENVIALINLARENGRITKYEAKLFIRNLDKYMAN